ncbi:MAG: DUF393 domain-containing protein [Flavobacterium sp.]|nr:MAG: DUF393 domain-containing protein [Flavobacterium sp.]
MKKIIIYYDNYCPNCNRFVEITTRFDWLNLITKKQLRNKEHIKNSKGINTLLAEKQMASFDGKWSYGYLTLFKIFLRLPILWVLIPFFFILWITKIGQFFYIQLAVNRQIIPLHCTEDSCELK